MRVDRFLSNLPRYNRQQVRLLLVEKRVRIDGKIVSDPHSEVLEFSRVEIDDEVLIRQVQGTFVELIDAWRTARA